MAPSKVGECIYDGALYHTHKHEGKLCNAWQDTKHLLISGLENACSEHSAYECYTTFITITSSSTMALPATYMRAALARGHYQNQFEQMCKDFEALPLLYCSSIEAHPGGSNKKSKKKEKEGDIAQTEKADEDQEPQLLGEGPKTTPTQSAKTKLVD